ncbi:MULTISPECIES: hypothetical protein [Streptomyces]|uniref:hypothetical protein n=1 Tax=Streptomyces TaxID=1883 RepID=UPI0004C4A8B7|nr:hypothetical protein [Streptomyces sp. NRRL S-146]
MPVKGRSRIRVARPSRDLPVAERLWGGGLGLGVLWPAEGGDGPREHDLLMLGRPDADWHLELVHEVARPEEHGGKRVESPNPYRNEWGVIIEDPDGYRLVLCRRAWSHG